MTEALIQYLQAVAAYAPTWGYFLIFIFMAIESSFIPFPSEVVMIPAGFLAARSQMTLGEPLMDSILSVAAGAVGSLAGAYFNYFLFGWLGTPFLERYGKYFLLPPPKLHRAEEIFRRYGAGTTFVCRLIPGIRHLISIPAGIARMPLTSFTLWTTVGAGLWVSILTAIGYTIGAHTVAMSYADLVHRGKAMVSENLLWILPTCVAGFAVYVWVSSKVMATKEAAQPAPDAS